MSEVKVNKISPRTNCGTTQLGDAGDTITITGDLKSNSLKSASGSTITLGQSGDTIQLGCGASQTGFGRTGTVDWDTTAKTAGFTAVSGTGYFVNTTSGAVTVTLPASPSAGDIVAVSDYAATSVTNNITIARNGSNIEGSATDLTIQNNGTAMTFVYVDGTRGWKTVNAGKEGDSSSIVYMEATGGTITECGNYKIHTFTGPGTFTVCQVGDLGTVDYLVVAGGAAGGGATPNCNGGGGGGGAGGYRESSGAASGCYTASPLGDCVSALTLTAQGYPITVGGGGAGGSPNTNRGTQGSNSTFSSITSAGGGGGGTGNCGSPANDGGSGGSGGGGGAACGPVGNACGGAGNTPPVSPPQGNSGGNGSGPPWATGGGGGATASGNNAENGGPCAQSGSGGNGATTSISGTPTAYAGGGGGGGRTPSPAGGVLFGTGGTGGGGRGDGPDGGGAAGTANTGGGGGGATTSNDPGSPTAGTSESGGSGIVIIRYRYQ